jgi:hypothetical protein
MYAYAMYQIHHRHISYSDVYLSQTPCKEAVTDSTFFKFNSEDITRLRQQIGQLLDFLVLFIKTSINNQQAFPLQPAQQALWKSLQK